MRPGLSRRLWVSGKTWCQAAMLDVKGVGELLGMSKRACQVPTSGRTQAQRRSLAF